MFKKNKLLQNVHFAAVLFGWYGRQDSFAFSAIAEKQRFGSVHPSPETLVRVAFTLFESRSSLKRQPPGWVAVFFAKG